MSRPAPAPPVLGTFDRCAVCHQLRDGDAPCPNCGDGLAVELVAPARLADPLTFAVPVDEVNGHRFPVDSDVCEVCGIGFERAGTFSCLR